MTTTPGVAALPVVPAERAATCPFDPPPEYAQWREMPGLPRAMWSGSPVWVVNRFEDIKDALSNPKISAKTLGELQGGESAAAEGAPPIFPRMDDPGHARLRRMLTKDFTVKRVDGMRPRIEEMANGFIDEMISKGAPADLVRDYALPIPSLVISALLGVPYADHDFFQQNTAIMLSLNNTQEEKSAATLALFTYLLELAERKEQEPEEDLISRLLREHVATGELGKDTVAMNSLILLNAGHETSANMIALGTAALLRNPAQLARIRDTDDPALLANAVEELLRYLTVVHSLVVRVAAEDVTIGGQLIKAGEALLMNLPAGNWDTTAFDDPGILDFDRAARGHLAFGYGVHQCLGQILARAELQIALPTLLRGLPGLRLAVPFEQLNFRNDMSIYGVHELPVEW
jgi:cytochrome P450